MEAKFTILSPEQWAAAGRTSNTRDRYALSRGGAVEVRIFENGETIVVAIQGLDAVQLAAAQQRPEKPSKKQISELAVAKRQLAEIADIVARNLKGLRAEAEKQEVQS